MGEAGPEAILPLRRARSGDLGVVAGGGPAVSFNQQIINNHPGAKVSTEERPNASGGMDLTVVIDAIENAMASRATRPGTTLNKALAAAASPVKAR